MDNNMEKLNNNKNIKEANIKEAVEKAIERTSQKPVGKRLSLNFSLELLDERIAFLKGYLPALPNATPKELETIADYLLYGKDLKGQNSVSDKSIDIPKKYSTWASKKEKSLEGLIETPGFNETQLLEEAKLYKTPKANFSRSENLDIEELHPKWAEIDRVELLLNYYDFSTGKRKDPPRDELLKRVPKEDALAQEKRSKTLTTFEVYRLRHYLVELRREQYTIRDGFRPSLLPTNPVLLRNWESPIYHFDTDINVFPLGIRETGNFSQKVFSLGFTSEHFREDFKKRLGSFLEKQELKYNKYNKYNEEKPSFNFADPSHLASLVSLYLLLELTAEELSEKEEDLFRQESTLPSFLSTFNFYREKAKLSEVQEIVLKGKLEEKTNLEISRELEETLGKKYAPNYISTIFRRQVLLQISKAAELHLLEVQTLKKEGAVKFFKKCNSCRRILLKSSEVFVRKKVSADGLSNKCRSCEQEARQAKQTIRD